MPNGWTGGQFSVVRIMLGLYLLCALTTHAVIIEPPGVASMAGAGAALAAILMFGIHRIVAAGLWVVLTMYVIALPADSLAGLPWGASSRPLLVLATLVLPVIALLPRAPFGSIEAWARPDPGGGWRYPPRLFTGMWVIVAGVFGVGGILQVPDWGWHVAERGLTLEAFSRELSSGVAIAGNWFLLGSWLALPLLALTRTTRPAGWTLVLVANVIVLPLAGYGHVALPLVGLSLLTFDPAWLPRRHRGGGGAADERETIFYDGHCGLCHGWVRFVLAEDSPEQGEAGELFVLAPQQGNHFHEAIAAEVRQHLPDSIVLHCPDGTLLVKSEAVRAILKRLGGLWRIFAWLWRVIPRQMRDLGYDAVARLRRKLFGVPADLCPMVPPHLRRRFRM